MAINPLTGAGAFGGGAMGQSEAARGVLSPREPGGAVGGASSPGGFDFAKALQDALAEVDQTQKVASNKSLAMVSGEDIPVHEVMAAVTEAEMAVQMTTAVAAKAIAAYQEIWRMEV